MNQEYSSKDTSIPNISRAISFYRDRFGFRKGSVVLDYGGGRYDRAIEDAKKHGYKLVVYDPFWRTDAYNRASIETFKKSPDYITCGNVLNVIKENYIVEDVVKKIHSLARKGTVVIFSVFERNKSGKGELTSKGWQRNEKTDAYLPLICRYFPNTIKVQNVIICQK